MISRKLLVASLALLLAACATTATRPPAQAVVPPQAPRPDVSLKQDVNEFIESLGHAQAYIAEREAEADAGLIADFEAASSIAIPDHPSVFGALNLFSTDLKPRIQASLNRSIEYRAMIDSILAENELPKALAYLPVIESGYITTNVSRAGAYGIWQFMPDTAREYGLRVDWWVDERADPEKSTRAAARYLKDLYSAFGDWSLALASYNAGPGRVKRGMHSARSTDFWDLKKQSALPRETLGYVPTFYATLMIVSEPDAHGFQLCEPTDQDRDWAEVPVPGPVSLRYVAEASGTDPDSIRRLNEQYVHGMLPPGLSIVRVPRANARRLNDVADSLHGDDPYLEVARYTVRKGDSLKSLSRHLGVDSRRISAMNGGAKKLKVGSSIFVPVSQTDLSAKLRNPPPKDKFHTVKKGETLFSIAQKNGLSVNELRSMNNLSRKASLRPGQKLRVGTSPQVTAGGM